MLISGPLLVVIIALLFVSPSVYSSPVVFGMVFFFFALTAVSALVPWDSIPRLWGALLPFANLAGILVLREFDPQTGVGLLVVLPIIWIARTFGSTLTIAGVAGTILAMWGTRLLRGSPITWNDFVTFVVVPVLVGFVAGAIYVSSARGRAQAKLLRQHSSMVQVALEKASRQEGVLNELLNAVDFGVIAFDRTGTVTFVNRAQRQYLTDFGTPADAVVHPVIYQADGVTLYTEDDRPLNRALSGQAFDNLIIWVGEPGERRAAHSVSSRILHDREGEYDGGVIVLTDITKELEAVRARDDLIGSVSHELRSPLTSILGYLDLARDDDQLDEETRRMIDVAYANSERLLVIVTDLLRAASDADQQLAMSFTAGDVAQIARDSVEAHRVMAEEREVELVMDGADSAVAAIDPMRMRQVLDNLITNAIKYNREWGTVTVAVEPGAGGVSVEVRDTGQGIPEADLPRIFDRFYRTKSAKSSATVGTGLGLSITREIVHRHGGHLTVTSELGIGTTFRVTVPTERESSANAGARSVAA
ncbi:sensor histidine kinase [Pseudolysinimonas yzui]|uniref:sensor histidine kinase n=1 Tax=Pseudolysinimonas yzui TaxID=2708254 RepID=UPI00174CAB2A|nr:PAS domain-containing sensor histidine kinase [Pseudolysinimonas yzui]